MDSPDAASGPRGRPRPFLKRGEGVQKRVYAPLQRAKQPISSVHTSTLDTVQTADQVAHGHTTASEKKHPGKQGTKVEVEFRGGTELQRLRSSQHQASLSNTGLEQARQELYHSQWQAPDDENEYELEEFKALESQIQAQTQHTQPTAPPAHLQLRLPPSKPPLAPAASGRSYANQHQKQQPASGQQRSDAQGQRGSYDHLAVWATQALQPPQQQQGEDSNMFQSGGADGYDDSAQYDNQQQPEDTWQDDVSFAPSYGAGRGSNPGQGRHGQLSQVQGQHRAAGAGPAAVRAVGNTLDAWRQEPGGVHGDAEEDGDQQTEDGDGIMQAAQRDPMAGQPFVRSLFKQQQAAQGGARARTQAQKQAGKAASGPSTAELEQRSKAIEEQSSVLASERAALGRLRTDLEKAMNRLEQERMAWEKTKAEEAARHEESRAAEMAKLARERRVLDKQGKALLKLPNKKERSALDAAEAALEAERREGRAREARNKLTVERLRRQMVELQDKNRELREEIRWHEEQALTQGWGPGTGAGGSASNTPAPPSVPGAAHSGGAGPRVGTAQRAGVGSTAHSAARFEATGVVGAGSMDGRKVSAAVDQGRPLLSNTGMASARDTTTASRFASSAGKHLNGAASAHSTQNRPASVGSGSRMQAGVPGSGTFKELPCSASKAGADEYDGQSSFYGLAAGQASNERSYLDARAYESGQGGWWGEATEGEGGMASEQGNGNSEQGEAEASLSGSGWEGAGHQVGGSMRHARSESPWPDEVSPGASEGSQGSPDAQHHAAGVQHTGPGRGALDFSQGQSGTRQHTAAHGRRGAASSTRSDRDLPPSAGAAASRQAAMRPHAAVHAGVQQQQQAWQPACSPASFAQGDMDEVCDGDGDGELEANAAKLAWEHHLSFMSQFGLEPTTAQARAQREHQAAASHAAAAQAGHGGHNRPGNRPSSSAGAHASSSATLHAQNPVSMPGAHTAAATGRSRPGSSGGGSGARQQLSGEPSFGSQQQHAMNSMPPAQQAGHVHAQQRQMQMQQEMPPMDATMTRSLAGVSQTLDLLRLDRQLGHGQYQQAPMHGATAAQGEPGAGHRHALSASTSAGPAPTGAPNGSAWPGFEQQAPGPDAYAAYGSGLNPQSRQAASGFRPADSTMRGGLAGAQHPITSQPHSHPQSVRQASLPSGSGCHETSLQGRTNTSGVQAAMGDVGWEVLVRDVAHADGKLEQVYASGKRKVSFPNGTCKIVFADGTSHVLFPNGDVKISWPSGQVDYYYSEVDTWQSTHPSGVEVFYFASGQTEAHRPDGLKEIVFADGSLRHVAPGGSERIVSWEELGREVRMPAPAVPQDV